MKMNLVRKLRNAILGVALLITAVVPFAASAQQKKWVRDASSSGEILLKLEGKLNGRGVFVFDGDTITYRHESEAEYPKDVTIDDMPWEDLTKPFKLDYATEAPKAVIMSRNGPNTVKLRKSEGKFEVEIDDSVYTWPSYLIVIASQHQADRKSTPLSEIRIQRPPTDYGRPAMNPFPSLDMNGMPKSGRPAFDEASGAASGKESPYQNDPDAPMFNQVYNSWGFVDRSIPEKVWKDGIRDRSITLEGNFFGNGTFVFEGDTITYRHETREYPSVLLVNDAIWGMPVKPFKLPFRIETAEFTLKQTKGDRPVKLTKFGDERFEVFFKDPESPPGSTECRYVIMIAPTKKAGTPGKQETAASAKTEAKPAQAGTKKGTKPAAGGTDENDVTDGRKTTRGDFHYNGLSDVIYLRKEPDGIRLEYGLDGVNDLKEQKTAGRKLPDPSFRFLGGYDMDKDHRVDIVAWRIVEKDSGKYIEVGYGKSGELDDWHVIGMQGIADGADWDLFCGNLSGHWDRNSILWHSPTLGALGYWSDGKGVDSWITVPGEYKGPDWKVLGLGDFTGARKPRDSVLLQYGANDIGYVTADGEYTKLGWLGEDWKIVAVDDFTNDRCDDLILFCEKLRQVGLWEGGKSSNWRSLGFVDDGTVIEGTGDFDGDAWMDLLVRKPDGSMGYFPKADLNKFIPFGYKKDSSWTVVP